MTFCFISFFPFFQSESGCGKLFSYLDISSSQCGSNTIAISGNVYGCIPSTFCEYASWFSNNAITSNFGYIIVYGWLSSCSFIGLVSFECYPYADFCIGFSNCCCLHSSPDIFIPSALCCKPMVGSWVICRTCSSWGINWSIFGLSYSSKIFIKSIFQEKGALTYYSSLFNQIRG